MSISECGRRVETVRDSTSSFVCTSSLTWSSGDAGKQWDTELEAQLVKEAEARGLLNLKGYRTVGGMRASLYNALPDQAVDELVTFLSEFEEAHLA